MHERLGACKGRPGFPARTGCCAACCATALRPAAHGNRSDEVHGHLHAGLSYRRQQPAPHTPLACCSDAPRGLPNSPGSIDEPEARHCIFSSSPRAIPAPPAIMQRGKRGVGGLSWAATPPRQRATSLNAWLDGGGASCTQAPSAIAAAPCRRLPPPTPPPPAPAPAAPSFPCAVALCGRQSAPVQRHPVQPRD